MRHLLLTLGAALPIALILGCSDQPSPTAPVDHPAFVAAEPSKNVFTVDIDFTDFLPCTGENIHWSGTATIRIHAVINRGAVLPEGTAQHFLVHVSVRLTGVGETTGATYRSIESTREKVQSESLTLPTGSHTLVSRTNIFGPAGRLVGVVRAHLIEVEYTRAMRQAELDWVRRCIDDIDEKRLTWVAPETRQPDNTSE